jgi:hypothetical protein
MFRPLSHKALLAGTVLAAGLAATACVPPAQNGPPPPNQVPPPPAPTFIEQAAWAMDETGGNTMHDSIAGAQDGTIGSEIILGGGVYEFPGWVNNQDGAGGLTGVVSETGGEIVVPDPTHKLEPQNGVFSVSGTIRARLTSTGALPNGGPGSAFNVVQKAHAPNTGGYWKVEVNGSGLQRKGKLLCTIGDGQGQVISASSVRVDDGNWHTFKCWLAQNKLVAEVDGQQAAVDASSIDTVHPVGKFSTEVVIGKKPGSTDPYDSFSGWLGELHIATG